MKPTNRNTGNTSEYSQADTDPPGIVYTPRQSFKVSFTGTTGEYFRIWIVNLILTMISDRSLDAFTAAEPSVESAIGEVATGFFDIDIGF